MRPEKTGAGEVLPESPRRPLGWTLKVRRAADYSK